MKNIFLIALICATTVLSAQTAMWSKDDRNNLYEECMSALTKYKFLTQEQRESIALCYLNDITKNYNKVDFLSKIDIEVKRIIESVISQCAKNIGVDLKVNEPVIESPVVAEPIKKYPAKKDLVGKWKTDKGSYIEFTENGTYNETTIDKKVLNGDWFLDDKGVLTINIHKRKITFLFKKEKVKTTKSIYRFDSFTKDYLKYTMDILNEIVQANRIN